MAVCRSCGHDSGESRFCDRCGVRLPYEIGGGQRMKRADTYLDGRPIPEDEKMELPPSKPTALHPQASIGLMDWSTENPFMPRRRKRAPRLMADLVPGKTGWLRKMFFLYTDHPLFFARLDMEHEFLPALLHLILVIAANAGLVTALSVFNETPHYFSNSAMLGAGASAIMFFIATSMLGMIVMSLYYKQFVHWRRIFAAYAYSALPLVVLVPLVVTFLGSISGMLPCLLALCLVFVLYFTFCRMCFEEIFGIDMIAAGTWSFLFPAVTAMIIYCTRLTISAWLL